MKDKRDETAIKGAVDYAKEHADPGLDYDKVYDAFLAGVEFQKARYNVKPDREYYGF
jgi:hypothetical protein